MHLIRKLKDKEEVIFHALLNKLLRIRSLKALSNRFTYYLISHCEDYSDCYYSGLEDGMAGTNQ